jgi:streptomycin 6-kinase
VEQDLAPAIPEAFLKKSARQFGEPGAQWVRDLPGILAGCIRRWDLQECVPLTDQSINLVCFARSGTFGEVVLKVQAPQTERLTEIESLRTYDGRHACRMLAVDLPSASFLMERVLPGAPLRALADRAEQLRIGIRMLRDLPVPVPRACMLPTYFDWLRIAAEKMSRDARADASDKRLLERATAFFGELEASSPPMVLHGDLHHDNILNGGRDRWVAIDPQGVIGPAFLEAGRFIQNHDVRDLSDIDLPAVRSTISRVASELGQRPGHIARTLFTLHVLSMCWDYEMMAPLDELRLQRRQCERMLELID